MSSTTDDQYAADLVSRFLAYTKGYSLRDAGALGSVSHERVATWRAWEKAGADPDELPDLQPATRRGLEDYLEQADDIEARRVALRLAADRLEGLVRDLREEAVTVSPGASDAEIERRVRGTMNEVPPRNGEVGPESETR